MKITKPLIFIAGVCVGFIVALYNDVLSKQPQPTVVEVDNNGYVVEDVRPDDDIYNGLTAWDIIAIGEARARRAIALDKTQPVKVERVNKQRYADLQDTSGGWIPPGTPYIVGEPEEVGAWEFDKWAKESE